jgi:putative transposase
MPGLFKNKFLIDSSRLKSWDYSTPWWYYITICTRNMSCCFGNVEHGKMILNLAGKIVNEEWRRSTTIRENVDLDYYVIMPNHIHGIIIIKSVETTRRVVSKSESETLLKDETSQRLVSTTIKPNSLSSIVGQFKSIVTKRVRSSGLKNFAWQPRFYDHIIRNKKDLHRIRTYIQNNPLKWELEEYYTDE